MAIAPDATVHPTSIIEEGAIIGSQCVIGPFCVIGPEVVLGERVHLFSHVVVAGLTEIGDETRVWPFASIGHQPQDLKFSGERTRIRIGKRNMIRESTSINPGTAGGSGITILGDDNLIVRAARLLRDRSGFSELGASIGLSKRIPIGAGLAGGSSDGAATLVGLNDLWGLGHTQAQLERFAADLGSDMPFCVSGGRQLCFGRGEQLEPCPETPTPLAVLLVKDPTVSVSTPWAYQRCRELHGGSYLQGEAAFEQRREQLRQASWLQRLSPACLPPLRNDLQRVVEPETAAVQSVEGRKPDLNLFLLLGQLVVRDGESSSFLLSL